MVFQLSSRFRIYVKNDRLLILFALLANIVDDMTECIENHADDNAEEYVADDSIDLLGRFVPGTVIGGDGAVCCVSDLDQ